MTLARYHKYLWIHDLCKDLGIGPSGAVYNSLDIFADVRFSREGRPPLCRPTNHFWPR
jgi:hypothetical protein